MSYPLSDIEKAIRANFIIVPDAKKFLEVAMGTHRHQGNAGRMLFVGLAYGQHPYDDIIRYSKMSLYDCSTLARNFNQYYARGKTKSENKSAPFDDPDIRIYRKTLLVRNYLNNLVREKIMK
jgi:hypothetical protein